MKDELLKIIEELSKKYNFKELKNNARSISCRYRNNDNCGKVLLNKKDEAIAYSLSRMPATMASNEFVIRDFIDITGYQPSLVFDAGAGTGASSLVIREYFKNAKLTLLEREESMISVAKTLNDNATIIKGDILNYNASYNYDLVITSYMLNELSDEGRKLALNKLVTLTNNYLIIIDAGTPKNYKQMMEIRDYLLSQGLFLLAPCPHQEKCKLCNNDWCHFSVRVKRSNIHRTLKDGKLGYEDEKFTYLIFSKKQMLNREYNRVIRHPEYRPKVVELKLCTKAGIKTEIVTKSNTSYKKARDLKWGDKI